MIMYAAAMDKTITAVFPYLSAISVNGFFALSLGWFLLVAFLLVLEYLNSVMDLFSRKIIAWTLSETLEVSCVIDTINKAKARRNIDQPLIIHSDRGSQYVATEYKKATENMQRSYSKKAFPWDNACIESFHSIIKREWLNRFKIHDYKQAYRLIFEYLEAFYNTKRIHSHCNYMSPNEFERLYERTHTEAELLAG